MASDSNEKNTESSDPGPASGGVRRTSARAPAMWGAVRSALASVFNLEALLRNRGVSIGTLVDLLPELRANAVLLRDAFRADAEMDAESATVAAYGEERIAELDAVLDAIERGTPDRDELAVRASAAADELEAATDLAALLDRSRAPNPTEVSLALVAREAGRVPGAWRGRARDVQFDEGSPAPAVATDPGVLATLLSLVCACVRQAGAENIVVRARSVPEPGFVVEAVVDEDAPLPAMTLGVLSWIPPAEAVARRVGENIGARVVLTGARATITIGKPPG